MLALEPPGSNVVNTVGGHSIARFLFRALCILVGAYLLLPALTAVHVEGLSAHIQSLSLAFTHGGIASHDPYLPLVTEFIFLTCPGVVDLLALLRGLGLSGDTAFRLLTVVSLAVLLGASVLFARNRGSVGKGAALAALILTPGVVDSGFFFNDNVVSAAFAALSLAMLTPMAASWRYLLSGVLAGMAALSRLDGLFVLPLLVGVVLIEAPTRPRVAGRLVMLAAGFVVTMGVSAAVNGATLLDSLLIGRYFSYARTTGFDLRTSLYSLRYFFGLVAPLLLVIGIMRKDQSGVVVRNRLDLAFFVLYPVALCVFAVMTGREVRYIYPLLSPVIALHAGRGVEWLLEQLRKPAGQRLTFVLIPVLAVIAVTFFVPPAVVAPADGPRALLGRLWSPLMWWRWQHGINQSMERLASLAAKLDRAPAPLIMTSAWNDEFYVHLRLMELGYVNTTAAETFPGCDGFSVYTRGQHRILHLRLHNEYYLVPYPHTTYGALAANRAADCPALATVTDSWLTTFGSKGEKWIDPELIGFGYERFQQPLEVTYARDWLRELVTHKQQTEGSWCCSDSLIDAVEITAAERATIIANARVIALNSANEAHTTPAAMFNAAREANRGRTSLTRDRWP